MNKYSYLPFSIIKKITTYKLWEKLVVIFDSKCIENTLKSM